MTETSLKIIRLERRLPVLCYRPGGGHQRRIISALTRTAEERYEDFLGTYLDVAQRLPQYAIASYLGMTTQFLIRIRKKRLHPSPKR